MRILTFADMGIGTLMFYMPVLRALAQHDLTIVPPTKQGGVYSQNEQLAELLKYNIKAKYEIKGKFDVSVNNFLSQDTRHLAKITGIPKRIGHVAWWRKRQMIFTDKIPINQDKSEEYYNCKLLEPLGMEPIFEKIKFPDFKMPSYDIIISPGSGQRIKDWEHWWIFINILMAKGFDVKVLDPKEYPLMVVCDLISKCKLFIGNDSGLAKISANLGIKTIQIFRWWTDCFVRCRVNGINLIEPSVKEVLGYL